MILLDSFFDNRISDETAVTIGKFDGFHKGHELLLDRIQSKTGLKSLVVTFDVSPRIKLEKDMEKCLITDYERRLYLENKGVDYILECKFDDKFSHTSPEDFIKTLVDNFNMKYMAVGSDFRFGYKGMGNGDMLKEIAPRVGFDVDVIEKLKDDGVDISSTLVRKEISEGNVEKAYRLLGYPYFIMGEIVHGNHIGSSIGVPTINQIPQDDKLLPSNGVYITEVMLENRKYHGLTNIGIRPTVGDDRGVTVETNILDMRDQNVYEKQARVVFLKKLRPEIKFDSLSELKKQISKDKKEAIEYLNGKC